MRNPQHLEDVTPQMRLWLLAIDQRHVPVNATEAEGGVPKATLAALKRRGWVIAGRGGKRMREIWKLTPEALSVVMADPPRLMAPASRPPRRHASKPNPNVGYRVPGQSIEDAQELADLGYTTMPAKAMSDEPEAVDEKTQEWITDRAGMTGAQWAALEEATKRRIAIEQRLAAARQDAAERGTNTSREIRIIEAQIAQMERKNARREAA